MLILVVTKKGSQIIIIVSFCEVGLKRTIYCVAEDIHKVVFHSVQYIGILESSQLLAAARAPTEKVNFARYPVYRGVLKKGAYFVIYMMFCDGS